MSRNDLMVIIPALKKKVAFQDDLVKKLNNIPLIQRAIYRAIEVVVDKHSVHVFTDSEEIRLIAERNSVNCYWDHDLVWDKNILYSAVREYLKKLKYNYEYALLLSPYAPLLSTKLIENAKQKFIESKNDILKPIKLIKKDLYDRSGKSASNIIFGSEKKSHSLESKAFTLFRTNIFKNNSDYIPSLMTFPVKHDLLEIESFQDWWACEKLLKRKRIVFRVIGNNQSGMGHIYRCLSIAHEVTDHEVIFVCDRENTVVIKTLAGYHYQLNIFEPDEVVDNIIKLRPDLVINDILSTKKKDIIPLRLNHIKTVSFEDLGGGVKYTDLTINELYEEPQIEEDHILWGHKYFFVRDEFNDAKPHRFKNRVNSILLTFGGTDKNDLTSIIYPAIRELCVARNIKMHIVTGPGYINYDKLKNEIDNNKDKDEGLVTLTNATGIISHIMEESQIAITSNGRTLYELAHMNIPAIVVSHHKRESTHNFACKENGFITVGVFRKNHSEALITKQLIKLLDDEEYRRKLFERTTKYQFNLNKNKVIQKIISLLPSDEVDQH
jgi:spore coat polysaccharide biosynthesis predicted glycosyltransferase SpsG/CMP-N-acetylneuraminic acid synthetase